MPQPGQMFSFYRIMNLLGGGKSGPVYRVLDLRCGCAFAVRFGAVPARVAALLGLDHPNIARLHDAGEAGGLPFVATEYLAGGSLRAKLVLWRVAGYWPTTSEIAWCGLELAGALRYAHARGITHGNLRLSNAMFAAGGALKLCDFGPEAGTPQADMAGLGAMLCELATGRPPATIRGSIRAARPDLHPGLSEIISTALLPGGYADAGQLAADLRGIGDFGDYALTESLCAASGVH